MPEGSVSPAEVDLTISFHKSVIAPDHIPASFRPRSWRSYALFSICASLYILLFMRFALLNTDEGVLLSGAERIVHGQVIARDFFEGVGPGSFYWLAAFFRLFGISFVSSRICLFLSSLGTGLLMYFLARRLSSRFSTLSCLVLVAALFPFWPEVSHHVDSNFSALLSVACMVLGSENHRRTYFITAGVLAGLTTCILQPKGVFLLCALWGWSWLQRRRFPVLSTSVLIASGYSAAIFSTGLFFWSQHALRSLVYAEFIYPFRHYESVNQVSYGQGINNVWEYWIRVGDHSIWSTPFAAFLILSPLVIASLPLLLAVFGWNDLRKPLAPEVTLYALAGAAIWLGEFHRKDITHLTLGSPLLLILCFYFLAKTRSRVVQIATRTIGFSALCLALLNLLIVTVGTRPLKTRVGDISTLSPTANISFLMNHVRAGEDIFVYPYMPSYYFFSGTKNPTPYSFLLYTYNLRPQFRDVIDILERRKIKYVVWDTTYITDVASRAFPGALPKDPAQLIVEPYLLCRYKVIQMDHGEWVMERKSDTEISDGQCKTTPM